MSKCSRAGYFAGIDRPIAWCECCRVNQNARYSKVDGKRLCKECRAKERAAAGVKEGGDVGS